MAKFIRKKERAPLCGENLPGFFALMIINFAVRPNNSKAHLALPQKIPSMMYHRVVELQTQKFPFSNHSTLVLRKPFLYYPLQRNILPVLDLRRFQQALSE